MKLTLVSAFASILAIAGGVCAAGPVAPVPKPPKAPGLTYLYSVNITGGEAAVVGQGPRGFRLVVPILRGSFAGPKLKGKCLPIFPYAVFHSQMQVPTETRNCPPYWW